MSPEISLNGHQSKGHDKCPPVPVVVENTSVRVGGKAVACVGDALQPHGCDDHSPHQGKISAGAPHVRIAGRKVARKGDGIDCGPAQDELGEGFATVRVGNCGGEEYGRELAFNMVKASLLPKATDKETLLLCLPDIAEAEAGRQSKLPDAQGWLYLQGMFHRWFSHRSSASTTPTPFWVDWDWVLSFGRALAFYQGFVEHDILNQAARDQLGSNLQRDGKLTSKSTPFDYAAEHWSQWETGYHTLQRVWWMGGPPVDGLTAAMATFTFRALASGYTSPNDDGTHTITVTEMSVIVHDVFNFEGEADLRYWDCTTKKFHYRSGKGDIVKNEDFRTFSARTDFGKPFLVLSLPHQVDSFQEDSYVYP